MNPIWKEFLLAQQATFAANGEVSFPGDAHAAQALLYPLPHLTVLTVNGKDAAKFLQGQCTCDINAITAARGGIGAFCNPKGRVIATFLIVKQDDAFLLILPVELAESISSRLQRYILRAAVAIADSGEAFCPLGISGTMSAPDLYPLPKQAFETAHAGADNLLRLPVTPERYLLLATAASAPEHWKNLVAQGFMAAGSVLWRNMDIDAGFPWLGMMSSEQFIPQMLNLDRLGGIGFNKGCYTGQEVVARTQYLGAVKRRMYFAECSADADLAADMSIVDVEEEPLEVGKLLSAHRAERTLNMLVVLQTAYAESKNLRLQNANQDKISVKPLAYGTDAAQPSA